MVAKIGRFIEMFLFSAGLSFGECLFYKNSNIICDSCDIELFLSTQYVPKVEQNVFFCFFVLKNILFFMVLVYFLMCLYVIRINRINLI